MCAHEHAAQHTPTPAPRSLSHFVTRELEKREYSASGTAPLSSPLIYGTSFSPCKKAKLTVGSLRVCACVIYQPHATAPPKRTKTTLCAILRSGRSSPCLRTAPGGRVNIYAWRRVFLRPRKTTH